MYNKFGFDNSMKYRLIASDYDGTLGNSGHEVSEKSIEVINKYREKGGVLTICSGRSHNSVMNIINRIKLKGHLPVISCQGALIKDSIDGEIYFSASIEYSMACQLIKELEDRKLYLQLYRDDLVLRNSTIDFSNEYAKITGVKPELSGSFTEYMAKEKKSIEKLILVDKPAVIEEGKEDFGTRYPEITFETTGPYMLEIYSRKAGKGAAVKYLAENILGLKSGEVMAFGDTNNDISMIKYAGFGTAVANAQPEVLKAADYISPSNDDNGVADTIEKFCF